MLLWEKRNDVTKSDEENRSVRSKSQDSRYQNHLTIEYSNTRTEISGGQRSILSTFFYRKCGSMTLEAAFLLPLCVFICTAFLSIFGVMAAEVRLQSAMERVGRIIAAGGLIEEKAAGLFGEKEDGLIGEIGEEVFYGAVSETVIKSMVLKELDENWLGDLLVEGGTNGISFLGSRIEEKEDLLTLRATYRVRFPFVPSVNGGIRVSQRSTHRLWTGKGEPKEEKEEEQRVYITDTGKAYHTSASCSYIRLSIREVPRATVIRSRNLDGGKYYACEICGDGDGETVYITGYGDRFHTDRQCSGLKRGIRSVPISEVGDRHLCTRCAGRSEE